MYGTDKWYYFCDHVTLLEDGLQAPPLNAERWTQPERNRERPPLRNSHCNLFTETKCNNLNFPFSTEACPALKIVLQASISSELSHVVPWQASDLQWTSVRQQMLASLASNHQTSFSSSLFEPHSTRVVVIFLPDVRLLIPINSISFNSFFFFGFRFII